MRILQFKAAGQSLSKDGDFSGLIAGTKGYLYAAYNFDREWGGNLGLATIASDGTVTLKANTAMVKVNISKNKNPYFGLTRR